MYQHVFLFNKKQKIDQKLRYQYLTYIHAILDSQNYG